jgi:hypothetical protein
LRFWVEPPELLLIKKKLTKPVNASLSFVNSLLDVCDFTER